MISSIQRNNGEVTLTITIPAQQVKETFARVRGQALKEVKLPGFRPGNAPVELAERQLDENALTQTLFQELVPVAYAQAVTKEGIKPIVPPQISIKEFKPPTRVGVPTGASGKEEDLVLEARTAERPAVILGDYKKTLKGLKGGEKITAAQVLEKLRETAKIEIPHLLVDNEVQRMLSSLIDQVRSLGLTIDQYLSSQGKTSDRLRQEYHEVAQKNLKDEFTLSEVAQAEKIAVSEKEIAEAIDAAPDEKTKAGLAEERGRAYLEDVLRKRKTIEFLLKITGNK